jgi:anthranilate synthase/aminodeoxychorismate synthase-like glutamine amidotransferase
VRIVIVDNYDSFTYNLYQQALAICSSASADLEVVRNDAFSAVEILRRNPAAIILSPGPGGPSDAGVCADLVRLSGGALPILGVCLGHQVIADVFGGRVVRCPRPTHGYASRIMHRAIGIFEGVPSPTEVGRYHSLMVDPTALPQILRVDARTDDGVIMALSHRRLPIYGVQFHPESFLSRGTDRLMRNFIEIARAHADHRFVAPAEAAYA